MVICLSSVGNRKGSCSAGVAACLLAAKAQDGLRSRHIRLFGQSFGITLQDAVADGVEGLRVIFADLSSLFYRPVLKHGPRSLTYMRLLLFRTKQE